MPLRDPRCSSKSGGSRSTFRSPGTAAEGRRPGPGGRRRQLRHQARRDAVAGRRERLRQDHDLALHPARRRADRGRDPARATTARWSTWRPCPKAQPAPAAAPDADDLPGSVLVAQSAHDAVRHRRRAAARARRGQRGRAHRTASSSCCGWSGCGRNTCAAIRTPSAAASASASASRARWRSTRAWSSPTNPSRRSTSRCRRRS